MSARVSRVQWTGAVALFISSFLSVCLTDGSASLNFVVLGDWGGVPVFPYFTLGEKDVAKAMGSVAEKVNSSFTVALGDNFYFNGVSNVQDSRFKETYEEVFTAKSLMSRWYMLAGNHDHYGNVTAQVDYTQYSQRWYFPKLYYTESMTLASGATVQFVMIDTVVLAGLTDYFGRDLPLQQIAEAAEVDQQLVWLNATLAASEAKWLFVCGHYPIWSVGEHGPTSFLVENVRPLLEKYRVTAYLNGHDHSMQHIRPANQSIDYFTIGAGHLTDASTKHEADVPAKSVLYHYAPTDILADHGGFASFKVTDTSVTVVYYDDKGNELYHTVNTAPRR